MAALLTLAQVTVRCADGQRSVAVLDRVSLEIDAGDFIGLLEVRPLGKSTLLRIIAGIEQPDDGSVCFDGHVLTGMSDRQRSQILRTNGIALASWQWHRLLNRSAVDHVAVALLSDGVSLREARQRARLVLGEVGAAEYADVASGELSLGQRIRVGLAAALVRDPRLLLIDEPAVLPNPSEAEELYVLLNSIARDRGDLAVMIASEDLAALRSVRRTFSLSVGVLRSMDREEDNVVSFPGQHAS